jgi:hypothetical protein
MPGDLNFYSLFLVIIWYTTLHGQTLKVVHVYKVQIPDCAALTLFYWRYKSRQTEMS